MDLLELWESKMEDDKEAVKFWKEYYSPMETAAYRHILKTKISKGDKEAVSTFAFSAKFFMDTFGMPLYCVAGFLEGLNEALEKEIGTDTLKALPEDAQFELTINFEDLFKKMVEYKADYLFSLEEWREVFTDSKLRGLFKAQKESTTIVHADRVGRNDPCPCGSGKKYKKCCGAVV
ncbi:hypothetical protein AGMMS49975_01860 [Clostridia bacterium]|nr:hypothetical protein AGMMS49975_01860 [Clostridia bacterium]